MGIDKKIQTKTMRPVPAESARAGFQVQTVSLSDQDRANLALKWDRKAFTNSDEEMLRADYQRALVKHGHDVDAARRQSASATCAEIILLYSKGFRYGIQARSGKQKGGFYSSGLAESENKPSRDQVLRAIKRQLDNQTPKREIVRRVREGGINLTERQIRNVGQENGLLPPPVKRKR